MTLQRSRYDVILAPYAHGYSCCLDLHQKGQRASKTINANCLSIISQYNLRNSNDLQTIDARATQYYNSFLPSSVRNWNNLPVEVRQSASVNSFKQSLNKNKTHVPKYYYSGSRQGQILHVRLRTNCSALNLDLFMRNITDSPLCRCGSIEDSQHFFFHCPYFQAPRYDLLNAVSQYQTPTFSIL